MSRHDIIAGRNYAIEILETAAKLPQSMFPEAGNIGTIAQNLQQTSIATHPADFSYGVLQVTRRVLADLAKVPTA